MSEAMKMPGLYAVGNEPLEMADGTVYGGLLGHYTIKDSPGPNEELGGGRLLPLESAEAATGHLREALSAGFTLVYLNIRPGWHHVQRSQ